MEKNTLNSMFENLLHIWNKTNFWNPKMKDYIYWSVNGIHIINLLKTWEKLEEVKKELAKLSKEGKKVLFVATKLQARDAFKRLAEETWNYYVSEKWVPGLLTNFKTIKRRIGVYLKLLKDVETWALDMLTKKEKAAKMLELEKLDKAYKWLKEMKKLPEVVFVVDGIYEKQSLIEANKLNITTFAIFNTNWDIDLSDNLIPANTNSVKSMDYLASELKSSFWTIKTDKKSTIKKTVGEKKISWEKKISKRVVKEEKTVEA